MEDQPHERSSDPIMGSKRERRQAQFELLRTLLHREMRGRYRDSILGSAWTLLQPIAMTGVYYFLFSFLFPNNSIPNYALFILTALILWNFFANCMSLGTTAITGSGARFRIMLTGAQDFTDGFWDQERIWMDIFKSADGSSNLTGWAAVFSGGFQYAYNGKTVAPNSSGYFALSGDSLIWSAVPEPGHALALAGLLAASALLRRRA